MRLFIIAIIMILLIAACSNNDSIEQINGPGDNDPQYNQGIYGQVMFLEGDFMPRPIEMEQTGTAYPVSRPILVFEKTGYTDVSPRYGPLYSEIYTSLVATVSSDEDGMYFLPLPIGEYSIFVEDDGKFFANRSSIGGCIGGFRVEANELNRLNIDINYKASY